MMKKENGCVGFLSNSKCIAAMRMIAYGAFGNTIDDYLHMVESTAIESMYQFCKAVLAGLGQTI
jgi:hypothetical protein